MQNLKIAYLRTTLMVMVIMMIRSYMDDAFIHDDDSWTNEQGDASSRIFQKLWYSTNYHQPCNFKFSSWYLNTSEKARKCIASLIYETICSPAPSALDNSQIYIFCLYDVPCEPFYTVRPMNPKYMYFNIWCIISRRPSPSKSTWYLSNSSGNSLCRPALGSSLSRDSTWCRP